MKRFLSISKITFFIIINMFFTETTFAANCTSITQHGITWTFSTSVECGQFVNSDWWVVAPVTINSQTPAWDGTKNGAMIDPSVGTYTTGYDTRANQYYLTYNNGLRVIFPVTINTGVKSLVSVIGVLNYNPTGGENSFVDKAAVLTIVNSAPSATSFRPPFVAGSKPLHDSSTVNYGAIPSYPAPATALNLTGVMNMPWLNYGGKTFGEENMVPMADMYNSAYPLYGASKIVSQMSMMMMLNTANRTSYINKLIQLGIDDYAKAIGIDFAWVAAGGYGQAHLWPIIFAGKMLGNSTMLSVPRYANKFPLAHRFGESGYTYYGSGSAPMFGSEECLSGYSTWEACTSNCMCRDPNGIWFPENNPSGNGGGYRQLVSQIYAGEALAMRMLEPTLGTMTAFNHPAFFDYTDYWVAHPKNYLMQDATTNYEKDVLAYGGTGNGFMMYMWNTYRNYNVPNKMPYYPIINPIIN